MERAQKRTNAIELEVQVMNGISSKGQLEAAKHVGVDRCQISRWISGKDSMLSKFCRLLEFAEIEKPENILAIAGNEAREIATTLRLMRLMLNPSKVKVPAAVTGEDNQITMEF
ncbi:CII family transcriptional regulator [Yersinia enterocolitica]|uniref:CII family transcriptional regulator n=2 Tax=Yersinia TaxID=629 RepID=UPI00065A8FB1|nr:CII family transcriptional regulator [Yersinia enterocolitica]CRY10873.1 Bacteriophage CII protein [Yersinia enterocolitica]